MSSEFLYLQLAREIRQQIETGTLKPGERLPSLRSLSENRQISLATVNQAYLHLEAQSFIMARPQSGFYVMPRPLPRAIPHRPLTPESPAPVDKNAFISQILEQSRQPGILPLGATILSPELLPVKQLSRLIAQWGSDPRCHRYAPTEGWIDLRRQIARRSLDSERPIGAEEVMVTAGCMEALHLSLRSLAQAGDLVAVESPTFYGILQAIESLGMQVLELPTDPQTGLDLEALEKAMKHHPIKVLVTVPSFQNPLGACMPLPKKQALLALAQRTGLRIIEDDIYGEFYYREPPPTLFSLDPTQQQVILCSSFSKTLAPGFRVGWVLAGPQRERILQLKRMTSLSTASLPQLVIADYLASGAYDRYLRRLRRQLENTLQKALALIGREFPAQIRLSQPTGGFILWLELPPGVQALKIYRQALAAGVAVAPGELFFNQNQGYQALRISLNQPWGPTLEKGLCKLGALLREAIS